MANQLDLASSALKHHLQGAVIPSDHNTALLGKHPNTLSSKPTNITSVECLRQLWAQRYLPDLSISSQKGGLSFSQLVEVASPEGRTKTVAKLKRLLQTDCEFAGIQTNALFSYIPQIVNLAEARRLAVCIGHVYEKALEIYLQPPSLSPLVSMPRSSSSSSLTKAVNFSNNATTAWALPMLNQLITVLEPVLLQLRERLLLASDSRTLGFMTTQFHFSSYLLLKHLTTPEQVLLSPYCRFIEEQVSIPLKRVCSAAARHDLDSPTMITIQQLLPKSLEIASTVYQRATKLCSTHCSRRGGLSDPGVMNSIVRDLQMFQAYFALCVLEGSMAAVEQELLPLCVMVFPSIGVTWKLVEQMLRLLIDELMVRVDPVQKRLLLPYTQSMQLLFSNLEKKVA